MTHPLRQYQRQRGLYIVERVHWAEPVTSNKMAAFRPIGIPQEAGLLAQQVRRGHLDRPVPPGHLGKAVKRGILVRQDRPVKQETMASRGRAVLLVKVVLRALVEHLGPPVQVVLLVHLALRVELGIPGILVPLGLAGQLVRHRSLG